METSGRKRKTSSELSEEGIRAISRLENGRALKEELGRLAGGKMEWWMAGLNFSDLGVPDS